MANFTLRQLRYFIALAEHRHFGRAAEACAISQPALSTQIKELETELGGQLVERAPRELFLTPLGEDVLERCRKIMAQVEDLGEFARSNTGAFGGRFRLGVIPTVAPYLLPKLFKTMSEAFPQVELSIQESKTERLLKNIRDGSLDAAILALPVSEPGIEEKILLEEDFVLVRHTSEASAPIPSADRLREMRLLLLEEGHCFRDQALSYCGVGTNQPRDVVDGSTLATLVQMVGAGLGLTLIPDMAVTVETQAADVSIVRFPPPQPGRSIGLIYRETTPLRDTLDHLINLWAV